MAEKPSPRRSNLKPRMAPHTTIFSNRVALSRLKPSAERLDADVGQLPVVSRTTPQNTIKQIDIRNKRLQYHNCCKEQERASGALSKQDLPDDFFNRIDLQRAAYVRSSKKGNSSIYMGLFHHIRNALAHARFSLKRNSNGDVVFIFEDGTINEKNKAFDLTARGILKLKSLIAIIDILEKGPDQQPDIEEQILAAIESGVNTKQRIKDELGIDNDDWIMRNTC